MKETINFLLALILTTWLNIFFFEKLLSIFIYSPLLSLLYIFCGFFWIYFTLGNLFEKGN